MGLEGSFLSVLGMYLVFFSFFGGGGAYGAPSGVFWPFFAYFVPTLADCGCFGVI